MRNLPIPAFFKNRYVAALLIFIIWVSFFDENNLVERAQFYREVNQMEEDIAFYKEKIEHDSKRLQELQTNNENLEKFAREQYLMRKPNEDVFVIVKE